VARRRRRFGSAQGPRKGRIGPGREFLVNPATCRIAPGELLGADRRFTYVPYRCLGPRLKEQARNRYPHNTHGIPASAYAYPFTKREAGLIPTGAAQMASGRRALLWGLARTKRKVRRS
jgi:hypothetical protein